MRQVFIIPPSQNHKASAPACRTGRDFASKDLWLNNQQQKFNTQPTRFKKIITAILKYQRINHYALSFAFVTSQKIARLNLKFLKRQYTTDVLAFDLKNAVMPVKTGIQGLVGLDPRFRGDDGLIGEIIISTDAVLKNARKYGRKPYEEFVLYAAHGILHLLGYDDHKPVDIVRMRKKEREILTYLEKRKLI